MYKTILDAFRPEICAAMQARWGGRPRACAAAARPLPRRCTHAPVLAKARSVAALRWFADSSGAVSAPGRQAAWTYPGCTR